MNGPGHDFINRSNDVPYRIETMYTFRRVQLEYGGRERESNPPGSG